MTEADRVHSTPPPSTSLNITERTASDGADTSRRLFLSQAAAVTAGGVAVATALSVSTTAAGAGQAPGPILAAIVATADAELIALGQMISELRILERKACATIDRCIDVFDAIKPEKPHVLLWREDDPIFLPPVFDRWQNRPPSVLPSVIDDGEPRWWIDMRHALQNEAFGLRPKRRPDGCDDLAAAGCCTDSDLARLDEALDAWHRWEDGLERARQDSGLADAEDKADVITAEMGGLFRQMLELMPQTLDGFRAIALAIIENCWSDEIPACLRQSAADNQGIAVLISALTGVPIGTDNTVESSA